MRKEVIIALIAAAAVLYYLYRKSIKVDRFFANKQVTITFTEPSNPTPTTNYQWVVCNTADCASDPSSWGTLNTAKSSPIILDNSICPTCDFGQDINFAIRSIDTSSGLTSSWVTSKLTLVQDTTVEQQKIGGVNTAMPLKQGDTTISYGLEINSTQYALTGQGSEVNLSVITVQRGSTTFQTVPLVMNIKDGNIAMVSVDTTVASSWNTAPGPLELNDAVTVTTYLADEGVVGPPWPDKIVPPTGPVRYYGNYSASVLLVAPSSPSDIQFSI